MNPNTPANWPLSSYTDSTWTDLVDEEAILANLSIANTSNVSLNFSIRLSDGSGNNLAQIVPLNNIESGDAYRVDLRAIAVVAAQTIQVWADGPGLQFLASGAVQEGSV